VLLLPNIKSFSEESPLYYCEHIQRYPNFNMGHKRAPL
jgi:hypothetical protein